MVQEFVPAPLPSGALEPSPADSAYHQRSGNGNPCVVVQEFVPVPLPSGALEQGLCDPVYHRRGGKGKCTMRTRAMCQEFVPGPSPKWCSRTGSSCPCLSLLWCRTRGRGLKFGGSETRFCSIFFWCSRTASLRVCLSSAMTTHPHDHSWQWCVILPNVVMRKVRHLLEIALGMQTGATWRWEALQLCIFPWWHSQPPNDSILLPRGKKEEADT